MVMNTHDDPKNREFTAQIRITDTEIQQIAAHIPDMIIEQLVGITVKELHPVIQERIVIDWKRVSEAVEAEIVRRIADTFQPPSGKKA